MATEIRDFAGRDTSEQTTTSPPAMILVASRLYDITPDSTIYTGAVIQSRLKQGEYGDLASQLVMFSRMVEADTHLSSIVQTRRLTVKHAEQQIVPPVGFEEDAKAAVAVAYLQDLVSHLIGWDDLIPAMIDGPIRGFYAAEIVWDDVVPIAVLDTPDDIWRWRSGLQYRSVEGTWKAVPPDKFVIHAPRGNSPSLLRRGAMRPIAKWWLIKNVATRDWAQYVELFGVPHRRISYPNTVSPDDPDLAAVVRAVQSMGSNGVVALRSDFDLEFASHDASGGKFSPHESLVRWCDAQMSKAILGQTLTVDTAQATGTYAAATVHNEVRLDLAQADAMGIAESIRRDIFEPAIRYGLGPEYPVPELILTIEDPKDEKTRADVLDIATNKLGLPISKATAYEELRIPQPESIDETEMLPGEANERPIDFVDADGMFSRTGSRRIERFAATPPLGEVPLALEALALMSDEQWRKTEEMTIPETIATMIRANPDLTPDEITERLRSWYLSHDPEDLARHVEESMNAAIVNAAMECDLEYPPDDEDEFA